MLESAFTKAGKEVFSHVTTWVIGVGIVTLCVTAVFFNPVDSTDAGKDNRSGMKLRIDHGTGCHYLETIGGGITPRLKPDGEHLCGSEQ